MKARIVKANVVFPRVNCRDDEVMVQILDDDGKHYRHFGVTLPETAKEFATTAASLNLDRAQRLLIAAQEEVQLCKDILAAVETAEELTP